jgi:hypothetical protein
MSSGRTRTRNARRLMSRPPATRNAATASPSTRRRVGVVRVLVERGLGAGGLDREGLDRDVRGGGADDDDARWGSRADRRCGAHGYPDHRRRLRRRNRRRGPRKPRRSHHRHPQLVAARDDVSRGRECARRFDQPTYRRDDVRAGRALWRVGSRVDYFRSSPVTAPAACLETAL